LCIGLCGCRFGCCVEFSVLIQALHHPHSFLVEGEPPQLTLPQGVFLGFLPSNLSNLCSLFAHLLICTFASTMSSPPFLSEEAQLRLGGQTQRWDDIPPREQNPRSLTRDVLLARVQELEKWQDEARTIIGLLSSDLISLQAEVEKLQLVTTDLLKDRSQSSRPQPTSTKPRKPPVAPFEDPSSDHGSVRSVSPSRTDSALNLEEGENDEEWAAVHLPKKVKVDALPKLGGKDREGLPYPKWKVDAKAQLDAVPGVSWLFSLSHHHILHRLR
jgi:hypothetical protein